MLGHLIQEGPILQKIIAAVQKQQRPSFASDRTFNRNLADIP